ncbi:8729_t:CDS:2 [Gigaspora rosea]|nr:8729_t:CDS:2 [Gigaspora rosea]
MYEPDYENISSYLSDSEIYSTLTTVNELDKNFGDNCHNHASTSLPLEHENSYKDQNDYALISLPAQPPESYSMLTTMNKLELKNFCTDRASTSLEDFCTDHKNCASTSLQLQPSTDENNFHYDNYCTD